MILMVPAETLDVGSGERAGTDDAHFSAADVNELRQFVQSSLTQPPSNTRDLLIAHGSELENRERPAVMTDTGLQE